MENFKLLATFLPEQMFPVVDELYEQNMWNWLNLRRAYSGSCHTEVDDVVFRFAPVDRYQTFDTIMNGLECVSYMPWYTHPKVQRVVAEASSGRFNLANLGRVVASKLKPEAVVGKHKDEGAYARTHHRLHLVLKSHPGNLFHCGDETLLMQTGELWLFNHQEEHWVENKSNEDRIHLIIDTGM